MKRRGQGTVPPAVTRPARKAWGPKFDKRLYDNPEGKMRDFGFGIMKKTSIGVLNTAEAFVRSKLRHDKGPLDAALCHRDVVGNAFVVGPDCPDHLARSGLFWTALDADVWTDDQHLAVAVTLWFPRVRSHHLAMRAATEFAQANLADARSLCVQIVTHAPNKIGHAGDLHAHLIISARTAGVGELGKFPRDLLGNGGQSLLHDEWLSFLAVLPVNRRPS